MKFLGTNWTTSPRPTRGGVTVNLCHFTVAACVTAIAFPSPVATKDDNHINRRRWSSGDRVGNNSGWCSGDMTAIIFELFEFLLVHYCFCHSLPYIFPSSPYIFLSKENLRQRVQEPKKLRIPRRLDSAKTFWNCIKTLKYRSHKTTAIIMLCLVLRNVIDSYRIGRESRLK